MVTVTLVAGGFLTTPKTLVALAKEDAWLTQVFGMVYALLITALFYFLSRRFPGKNLFDITFALFGKWLGGFCNLIFLLHFISVMIRDIGVFNDFMNTNLLIRTPGEIIVLLLVLLLIYFGKSSVEVSVRVNDLIFPVFLGMVLLVPLLLSNEFSMDRVRPILGQGLGPLTAGNIIGCGWYGDLLVSGAFIGMIGSSKKMYAALRHGVMATAFLMSMVLLCIIGVLGTEVAARLLYPNYSLVEQIHITDYLDRIELVVFSIWLPIFVLKVAFIFLASLTLLNTITNRVNYKLYNKQFGWLILFLWLFAFQSVIEVFNFANYGPVLMLLPHQIIYLLLYLFGRRRKVVVDNEAEADSAPKQPNDPRGQQGVWQWFTSKSEKTWRRVTNWAVATILASVCAGAMFGQVRPTLGTLFGGIIFAALIVGYVSTYLEMRQVNIANERQQQREGRS